jgi:hypothetical protein
LLRRDWIAAIEPAGVPNIDIIVTDVEGNSQFAVQVKTRLRTGDDKGWHMSEKHEKIISPTLFYCLVDMDVDESNHPAIYIVPSDVIAQVLLESHKLWLKTPGMNGRMHNDTKMRRLIPKYKFNKKGKAGFKKLFADGWLDQYKENWKQFS